jgi:hypothetical protein
MSREFVIADCSDNTGTESRRVVLLEKRSGPGW